MRFATELDWSRHKAEVTVRATKSVPAWYLQASRYRRPNADAPWAAVSVDIAKA